MKKRNFILLSSSLVLAVTLSACGNDKGNDVQEAPAIPEITTKAKEYKSLEEATKDISFGSKVLSSSSLPFEVKEEKFGGTKNTGDINNENMTQLYIDKTESHAIQVVADGNSKLDFPDDMEKIELEKLGVKAFFRDKIVHPEPPTPPVVEGEEGAEGQETPVNEVPPVEPVVGESGENDVPAPPEGESPPLTNAEVEPPKEPVFFEVFFIKDDVSYSIRYDFFENPENKEKVNPLTKEEFLKFVNSLK